MYIGYSQHSHIQETTAWFLTHGKRFMGVECSLLVKYKRTLVIIVAHRVIIIQLNRTELCMIINKWRDIPNGYSLHSNIQETTAWLLTHGKKFMGVQCSLVVKYKRPFRDYQASTDIFAYDQMLGSHNQKCNQTTAR